MGVMFSFLAGEKRTSPPTIRHRAIVFGSRHRWRLAVTRPRGEGDRMQNISDSRENADLEEEGRSGTEDPPGVDDPTPSSSSDSTTASTVLVEVLPGVAVVFGEVPAELSLELVDFGLVSVEDRTRLSTVLASVGNTATVGGNVGNVVAGAQGLYRLSSATQAVMKAGGTLAVKNGANLGAVIVNGKIVSQARWIPAAAVSLPSAMAVIGPALAMVAIQMSLNEIAGLARTNIALTSQVLATIRHEQWAELEGLVDTVDDVLAKAREIESVPASLWDTVAASKADLSKQRDLYRRNVRAHLRQIDRLDTHGRREYLQANADAIVFDAYALLSSLKAWIGYQALHAARARVVGPNDADEARLVDVIARDAREELDSARAEMATLVGSLRRELRLLAELPGRATLPLTQKRRDSKGTREISTRLLEAIEPLADVLCPQVPPIEAPGVVCAPDGLDHEPFRRILRWFLEDGENLRCLGFPDSPDARDVLGSVGQSLLSGRDPEKSVAAMDRASARMLVAVTDRRVITGRTNVFRQEGMIGQDIPIDRVRYVRVRTGQEGNARSTIDLITSDENISWRFAADTDDAHVDALAAVLAESMAIPEAERDALARRGQGLIGARKKGESVSTVSVELAGADATASVSE